MKLFVTSDLEASVRKAHADFTHVILDRTYHSLRPVFFCTGALMDLPIYLWADWLNHDTPLQRWQAAGGVLICRGNLVDAAGPNDVTLFVECPFSIDTLSHKTQHTVEYTVLPIPNWRTYEQALDTVHPPVEDMEKLQRALWKFGSSDHPALTLLGMRSGYVCMDIELADELGIPHTQLQYMHHAFKPRDVYHISKRLAPEQGAMREVFGKVPEIVRKNDLHLTERKALKEMDRLGHIRLTKYRVFPNKLLNIKKHAAIRDKKLSDLAAIRSLVESLPDHLQT